MEKIFQPKETAAIDQFVKQGYAVYRGVFDRELIAASKEYFFRHYNTLLELAKSGKFAKPITTEIVAALIFYPAEEYHKDYHKKNPLPYKFYRFKCGRDQYLEKIWGKSSDH